jgi:tetratricopeptide (TPR) repeat protein
LAQQTMKQQGPVIFVSAVAEELHPAREAVVQTLTVLDCRPQWQDMASGDARDLRGVLRKRLQVADAVIQLVGHCYGPAPAAIDPDFGECSYAQFEALSAMKSGKPVWRLILDKGHPTSGTSADTNAERCLQSCYRDKILASDAAVHRSSSLENTLQFVRDIRADFPKVRRQDRSWVLRYFPILNLVFAAFVVLGVGTGGFRNLFVQLTPESSRLSQAVNMLPNDVLNWPGTGRTGDQHDWIDDAYMRLERRLAFDKGTLRPKLETHAARQLQRDDLTKIERAHALFCGNRYLEAEDLAALAADAALQEGAKSSRQAITALGLAGIAAWADRRPERALEHFVAATSLVDKNRAPMDWAGLKWREAFIRDIQGRYAEAVRAYRPISAVLQGILGPDDPHTLMCFNNLANSLRLDRKFDEAEALHRMVLARRENGKPGRESADCLVSRRNLAWTLEGAGRYDAAVKEYELLFDAQLRLFGAEHPDTLQTRADLAGVYFAQEKYAEAEERYRIVLPILRKTLGAWHIQTVTARRALADVWMHQDRYAEAEKTYRSVLAFAERNWGAKHPDTLGIRNDLGVALLYQQKYTEAGEHFKTVIAACDVGSDSEQPDLLVACGYLSLCLEAEDRLEEGLALAKRAESGWKELISESGDWVEHTWLRFAIAARERIQEGLTAKN